MSAPLTAADMAHKKTASLDDICDSMKQQLLILVEWAKYIPSFCELPLDDQVRVVAVHNSHRVLQPCSVRAQQFTIGRERFRFQI